MKLVPLFIYGAAIGWFSLTPVDQYPIDIWDKLVHFFVYAIFVGIAGYVAGSNKNLVRITCGIILYGALLEVIQSFVPGRSMSALDCVANSLGALSALLITMWFRKLKYASGAPD
jgi:VanZ family protein